MRSFLQARFGVYLLVGLVECLKIREGGEGASIRLSDLRIEILHRDVFSDKLFSCYLREL